MYIILFLANIDNNIRILKYIILKMYNLNIWGLGIGDWGLGIGDWGLGPIPNPQSPIPHPHILKCLHF